MFTKKNKSENHNDNNTLKSWVTGKIASTLIGSAVCYALYKTGIFAKIKSYFTKKPTTPIFSDGTENSNTNT